MRIIPSQTAIWPIKPMASCTAVFAESMPALVAASMVPVKAAVRVPPAIRTMMTQFNKFTQLRAVDEASMTDGRFAEDLYKWVVEGSGTMGDVIDDGRFCPLRN